MESAPQIFQPVSVTPGVSEVEEIARGAPDSHPFTAGFYKAGMEA